MDSLIRYGKVVVTIYDAGAVFWSIYGWNGPVAPVRNRREGCAICDTEDTTVSRQYVLAWFLHAGLKYKF